MIITSKKATRLTHGFESIGVHLRPSGISDSRANPGILIPQLECLYTSTTNSSASSALLQPHKGSSVTNFITSNRAYIVILQPHKGSSVTGGYQVGYDQTRTSTPQGFVCNSIETVSEVGPPPTSTPQGFVCNRRAVRRYRSARDTSTPQGFVCNSENAASSASVASLQPHKGSSVTRVATAVALAPALTSTPQGFVCNGVVLKSYFGW